MEKLTYVNTIYLKRLLAMLRNGRFKENIKYNQLLNKRQFILIHKLEKVDFIYVLYVTIPKFIREQFQENLGLQRK